MVMLVGDETAPPCLCRGLWPAAANRGGEIATVYGRRQQTWAELYERVTRLARVVGDLVGHRPGGRICVLSLNSDVVLELLFAAAYYGATLSFINYRCDPKTVAYQVALARPDVILVTDSFTAVLDVARRYVPHLRCVFVGTGAVPAAAGKCLHLEEAVAQAAPVDRPECPPGSEMDVQVQIFTENEHVQCGIEACEFTHQQLWTRAMALDFYGPETRFLHTMPLFTQSELLIVLALASVGACNVITPAFRPETCVALVSGGQVTDLVLSASQAKAIEKIPDVATRIDGSSIRTVLTSSAKLEEWTRRHLRHVFPRAHFCHAAALYKMRGVAGSATKAARVIGGTAAEQPRERPSSADSQASSAPNSSRERWAAMGAPPVPVSPRSAERTASGFVESLRCLTRVRNDYALSDTSSISSAGSAASSASATASLASSSLASDCDDDAPAVLRAERVPAVALPQRQSPRLASDRSDSSSLFSATPRSPTHVLDELVVDRSSTCSTESFAGNKFIKLPGLARLPPIAE